MKVFKFGGASVKDAEGVKNVSSIIARHSNEQLLVVISAMGKTTNALEEVINAWWNKDDYRSPLMRIEKYHIDIINDLFEGSHPITEEVENLFLKLRIFLEKPQTGEYDRLYDQVVSYGEIISTKIVSAYLRLTGITNKWLDAREIIVTDGLHRQARVDWQTTVRLINEHVAGMLHKGVVLTQGFIGSFGNDTTTLGREGSDYTAAIFAYALNAEEVVIWKDVPGVMNADPRRYSRAVLFPELSYEASVEMTYYGATVLHPKTIKPLQNKRIKLNVRSFINPEEFGTIIHENAIVNEKLPVIIFKRDQCMLELKTRDFSFIAEEHIAQIFNRVVEFGINVNLMSNTAISFNMCIDDRGENVDKLMESLSGDYETSRFNQLQIITIKHPEALNTEDILTDKNIILEAKQGNTMQYVVNQ